MIDAEKFRKEILENLNKDPLISVNKHNNEIEECTADNCLKCLFNVMRGNKSCFSAMLRWLLSEYKEPIKLSKLEYELLRHLYKTGYSYIVRDGSNSVYVYEKRPCRINLYWAPGDVNHNDDISLYRLSYLFQFLKWSDEEPTLIQDILNNCAVIDDDL